MTLRPGSSIKLSEFYARLSNFSLKELTFILGETSFDVLESKRLRV